MRSIDDSRDVNESVDVDEVCIYCVFVFIVFIGYKGLLDEGESSMEDGEVENKVS